MSEKKILTFELSPDGDEIDIHCNEIGLLFLKNTISDLLENVKSRRNHVHLMTNSWAGNELTEEKQSQDSIILNKVTIHAWPSD